MTVAVSNVVKAKMIMIPATRIAQMKIGMRLSDMPGARNFRMVTTISIPAVTPATSTKLKPNNQKSTPMPENFGPESGV